MVLSFHHNLSPVRREPFVRRKYAVVAPHGVVEERQNCLGVVGEPHLHLLLVQVPPVLQDPPAYGSEGEQDVVLSVLQVGPEADVGQRVGALEVFQGLQEQDRCQQNVGVRRGVSEGGERTWKGGVVGALGGAESLGRASSAHERAQGHLLQRYVPDMLISLLFVLSEEPAPKAL